MRKSEKKMIKNVSSDTKSSTDLSLRKSHSIAHSTAHSQVAPDPRSASARTNQFCAISDTCVATETEPIYPHELKKGNLFDFEPDGLCIFLRYDGYETLHGHLPMIALIHYIDCAGVRQYMYPSKDTKLEKIS